MERLQLIQELIKNRNYKSYLEIGVRDGDVFFAVECDRKFAVDPSYDFGWKEKAKKNIDILKGHKFFTLTSDEFFGQFAPSVFPDGKIDIVLVDGMHEFEFVLRDITNALEYLSENGIIIVHDCNPLSKEAACSFKEWEERKFTGIWNGDVWKSILFLRETRKDLIIFVADTDYGLGIISKRNDMEVLKESMYTYESIKEMSYEDLVTNRKLFLNLKPPSSLRTLFSNNKI